MTFREGGAFDYHTCFEQVKERLHHVVTQAREEGRNVGATGVLSPADIASVHLEQLPAYEPAREVSNAEHAAERGITSSAVPATRDSGVAGLRELPRPEEDVPTPPTEPPSEPPPAYEEAQAQALRFEFDQRLRDEAERL
jgi:hypothetical protein